MPETLIVIQLTVQHLIKQKTPVSSREFKTIWQSTNFFYIYKYYSLMNYLLFICGYIYFRQKKKIIR